jgi:hypothetical protein
LVHGAIAHDAFLDQRAAGLELRLDQRDELRRFAGQRESRRQNQP